MEIAVSEHFGLSAQPPGVITPRRKLFISPRLAAQSGIAGTIAASWFNSTNIINGYTSVYPGSTQPAGTVYSALGVTGMSQFGNISPIWDCVAAAQAIDSLVKTSCTAGQQLYFPTGTLYGSSPYPASSMPNGGNSPEPGVLPWAQRWGMLYSAVPDYALAEMGPGTWPYGGMVDAAGNQHPVGAFGKIDYTNQAEVMLAIQYFGVVQLPCNGTPILSAWSGNRLCLAQSANTSSSQLNHMFCGCDYGTLAQLAAQYSISLSGVTLPAGVTTSTFCIGGLTWGAFVIVDWQSWVNLAYLEWFGGAYVRYTDFDWGNAGTLNAAATAKFQGLSGASGIRPIVLGPFLSSSSAGTRITSGTPTLAGYVNGSATQLTGQISAVDSLGYARYIPSAADMATVGQLVIDATLSGADPVSFQTALTADSVGNGQPLGTTALGNVGFTVVNSTVNTAPAAGATQLVTNITWAYYLANLATTLFGQTLTFTSGAANGQGYLVTGGTNASGSLVLTLSNGLATAPAAYDAFTLSNAATANSLYTSAGQVLQSALGTQAGGPGANTPGTIPTINANGVVPTTDQSGANGSDGSPLQTIGGGAMLNPAAQALLAAIDTNTAALASGTVGNAATGTVGNKATGTVKAGAIGTVGNAATGTVGTLSPYANCVGTYVYQGTTTASPKPGGGVESGGGGGSHSYWYCAAKGMYLYYSPGGLSWFIQSALGPDNMNAPISGEGTNFVDNYGNQFTASPAATLSGTVNITITQTAVGFQASGTTGTIPASGSITLNSQTVAYTWGGGSAGISMTGFSGTPSGSWTISGASSAGFTPASGYTGTFFASDLITLNGQTVAYSWNGTNFTLTGFSDTPSGTWTIRVPTSAGFWNGSTSSGSLPSTDSGQITLNGQTVAYTWNSSTQFFTLTGFSGTPSGSWTISGASSAGFYPASGTTGTILSSGLIVVNGQTVAYSWNGTNFTLTGFSGTPSGNWSSLASSASSFTPASGYSGTIPASGVLLVNGVQTPFTWSGTAFALSSFTGIPNGSWLVSQAATQKIGNVPSASQIATAVWTDTTAGDFTVNNSPGKQLLTALPAAVAAIPVNPYTGTPPTAATIAIAVAASTPASTFFANAPPAGLTPQQTRDALTLATSATPAAGSIDAQLGALAAIVSTSPIQVRSMIDAGGAMTIVQGADYPTGQAICFGVPSTFMSLAGSTPSLEFSKLVGGVPTLTPLLVATGTLQTGSLVIGNQTFTTWLQFTLTAAQTSELSNLNPQSYVYRVRCYWYNSATPPAVTQTIEVVSQSPCTAVW
jgi:hypothetical protein